MIYKDHNIEWFIANRSELYNYIKNEVIPFNKKFKLVHAPVKSGKRGMVEIYSLLDTVSKHIFLTALHRRADKSQRDELSAYGINVFSVNNTNKKDDCIKCIDDLLLKNHIVKIHLDELDFGCGNNQLLNKIWTKYKTNTKVHFILYSATIEVAKKEFLTVNDIEVYECRRYVPPAIYFGIKNYLQSGKFIQAESFIDYNEELNQITITSHGEELIQKLISKTNDIRSKQHISILRLAGNMKIDGKQMSQFEKMKEYKEAIEEKYGVRLRFVGSNDTSVEWDNQRYWEELASNLPFIIVINQVSGRSTEWKCHPFIVWYHTLRTDETPTGTIIQDQERPVYYTINYTDIIDIEIYGDLPSAQYSAGEITLEQMLTMTSRKLNSRLNLKSKKSTITAEFEYFDNWDAIPQPDRIGKSLSTYINEYAVLKPKMSIIEKINNIRTRVEYDIKNWDRHSSKEGFIVSNRRGNVSQFVKGKTGNRPILYKSDIESDIGEGINETSRIRINVVYEDNETNPDNYKFIVRRFIGSREAKVSNKTMYNT